MTDKFDQFLVSGTEEKPDKFDQFLISGKPTEKERKKSYRWSEVPGTALSSTPSGLIEYGKGLINPESYKSLKRIGESAHPFGWVMNLYLKGELPFEEVLKVGKQYGVNLVEKYGSIEKLKRTLAEKPIEVLSDLSLGLTGVGGVSKVGALSKLGKAIEPLSIVGKGLEKGASLGKRTVSGPLGISTGAGKIPVEKSMEASQAFKSALRGKVTGEEIIEGAKGGVYAIKGQRGNSYRQELAQIKNMSNPPQMDIVRPVRTFANTLKDYNIALKTNQQGKITGLDFSRSSIRNNELAQKDFSKVVDTLKGMLDDPGYFQTPEGFDILKRQLDDMYKESSQGRVLVTRVSGDVRDQLTKRVPGYEKMTKQYEQTTKLINEIERDLSMKQRGSIDTALRKLNTAMREDDDFRRSLIAEIEKASGQNIQDMISGRLMSTWMPKSWMGREIAAGTLFASMFGNPAILPALSTASPRLIAETMMLLSKGEKIGKKITSPNIAPLRQIPYQASRAQEEQK